MSPRIGINALLSLLVLVSAVAVVLVKHESRKEFVALQGLERRHDELVMEWRQLQLEQGTWATHARIESISRKKLGLAIPTIDDIVLVAQ